MPSTTLPGYGLVIHEAGVVKVGPSGDVEHPAGPSDLGDDFEGDISAAADLCAGLTGG